MNSAFHDSNCLMPYFNYNLIDEELSERLQEDYIGFFLYSLDNQKQRRERANLRWFFNYIWEFQQSHKAKQALSF